MERGGKLKTQRYKTGKRRREVAELYLKGHFQSDIAEKMGVSVVTVGNDLKYLRKLWEEKALQAFSWHQTRELAKIDKLEREYWEAWERSREERKQKILKARKKSGKVEEMERTERDIIAYGDPRFLQGVQWCISKRCEILGIDAELQAEMRRDESRIMRIEIVHTEREGERHIKDKGVREIGAENRIIDIMPEEDPESGAPG